jgi:hypothetical protein
VAKSKSEIQKDYLKRTGYRATKKYNKESTKLFNIRLVVNTEKDIIEWLEGVENKSGYIKQLIRMDMAEKSENEKV